MKLNAHSRHKMEQSWHQWRVTQEHRDIMDNYLIQGFNPGSFYTALLANDAMRAIQCSHPVNRMQDLKTLVGWIQDHAPESSWGSYDKVTKWCEMTDAERRTHLEAKGTIHDARTETWLSVSQPEPPEPLGIW